MTSSFWLLRGGCLQIMLRVDETAPVEKFTCNLIKRHWSTREGHPELSAQLPIFTRGHDGRHFIEYLHAPLVDSAHTGDMQTDRRKSPRRTVHIKATLVAEDGITRLPALILDQSNTGLRVRLAEAAPIPVDCYILFERRIEPCRVAWQNSCTAGLAFTL